MKKSTQKKKKTQPTLSRGFKKTPRDYRFSVSLADAHQSALRYNTADCIHATNNMDWDVALLRILYESLRAIRNRVRNTLNAEDNQLLLLLNAPTESLPTRLLAVPGGDWVQLFPLERFHCIWRVTANHTGVRRGWFLSELGKGLSIFLFPSYTAAPAAGVLAMLLVPCGCLSPDVSHTFF